MSDSSGYDQEFQLKMLENAVQYQPGNHDVMKTETVYADNKPVCIVQLPGVMNSKNSKKKMEEYHKLIEDQLATQVSMLGYIPLNGNWDDVAKYVEEHLPDGEWLVRDNYDVNYCRHQVLIENLATDFHVRMDINNADWNKMYAIDLVNQVLKHMIANSPQKIQPIEPDEPKIMKCEVCGGPMEAPYTLCKFCGQTYKIGGKV